MNYFNQWLWFGQSLVKNIKIDSWAWIFATSWLKTGIGCLNMGIETSVISMQVSPLFCTINAERWCSAELWKLFLNFAQTISCIFLEDQHWPLLQKVSNYVIERERLSWLFGYVVGCVVVEEYVEGGCSVVVSQVRFWNSSPQGRKSCDPHASWS